MDLHPLVAELGFKFSVDPKKAVPHRLKNEADFKVAINRHQSLCLGARSRLIIMQIHNLVRRFMLSFAHLLDLRDRTKSLKRQINYRRMALFLWSRTFTGIYSE